MSERRSPFHQGEGKCTEPTHTGLSCQSTPSRWDDFNWGAVKFFAIVFVVVPLPIIVATVWTAAQ